MNTYCVIFWSSAVLVVYTCAVYPLLLALLARFRGRPVRRGGSFAAPVSIVVAAHNEEDRIEPRLRELSAQLAASDLDGEVILVSDGSTDRTAAIAAALGAPVRLVELETNVGKAAALNQGCTVAQGQILVFADVRQRWAPTRSGGWWTTSPIRTSARSAVISSWKRRQASSRVWACTGGWRKGCAGWSRAFIRRPA